VLTRILKECSDEISDALVLLFTTSLKQGKIPEEWKHAIIAPLHKGGNKNHGTYPTQSNHATFLSSTQHSFRKHRSCETQLIQTVCDLAKAINDREQIDSVLLDLSKAFDKVGHLKLLH